MAHNSYSNPSFPVAADLSSPRNSERVPLFFDQRLSATLPTPPLSAPGFRSYREAWSNEWVYAPATPRTPSSFASSLRSPAFGDPQSYLRELPEIDETDRLVGPRDPDLEFVQRMDVEIQNMRDQDSLLKRRIRKFRFVVRTLDLGCRYYHDIVNGLMLVLWLCHFSRQTLQGGCCEGGLIVVFHRTADHLITLPDGSQSPAWSDIKIWPAIVLLSIASVSTFLGTRIFLYEDH
jgi:hypothetical protein